ncbi:MAG TPA: hypothetical protein VFA04_26055 [Bryobacteraceae bacterium]|nr:hypothetical protein [Bryobacteraceae bacterium]
MNTGSYLIAVEYADHPPSGPADQLVNGLKAPPLISSTWGVDWAGDAQSLCVAVRALVPKGTRIMIAEVCDNLLLAA